jgi:hypothetical protein
MNFGRTLCDWAGSGPLLIGATGRGLHRTAVAPSQRHDDGEVGGAAGAMAAKCRYGLRRWQLG